MRAQGRLSALWIGYPGFCTKAIAAYPAFFEHHPLTSSQDVILRGCKAGSHALLPRHTRSNSVQTAVAVHIYSKPHTNGHFWFIWVSYRVSVILGTATVMDTDTDTVPKASTTKQSSLSCPPNTLSKLFDHRDVSQFKRSSSKRELIDFTHLISRSVAFSPL
jgi:hypothetical protein